MQKYRVILNWRAFPLHRRHISSLVLTAAHFSDTHEQVLRTLDALSPDTSLITPALWRSLVVDDYEALVSHFCGAMQCSSNRSGAFEVPAFILLCVQPR